MARYFDWCAFVASFGLAASVSADVTLLSQQASADAFVQRADTGDPLDEATDFDDSPGDLFTSVFARYDVPDGGVVDGGAEAGALVSVAEISMNGFASSNATALAFEPEVFTAVTSGVIVEFEVDRPTVVRVNATLATMRNESAPADPGSVEVSSSFQLLGEGFVTILNAFNDEGQPATEVNQVLSLNTGSYTLEGFSSVTEQADELFDVSAMYEVVLVFDPQSACPADLDLSGAFDQGDVVRILDDIDLFGESADWDASGEIDAFDLFAFLTDAESGCE
ncbi:MAG: hypothetical protein AAGB34_03450 [Planctomycetota bacterium]